MKRYLAVAILLIISLAGCAGHQTATEQVMDQTGNPVKIAQAMVIDAEDNYKLALDVYSRYRPLWEKNNPDLVRDVDEMFVEANDMLEEWHKYAALGMVDQLDTTTFPGFRRSILIIVAEMEGLEVPK